jgi:hypothetical protein
MPSFRKLSRKAGGVEGVRRLIGAKERDILLHKLKKDVRKLVECCEFAWIGFGKSDVSHRFGDPLRLSLFCSFLRCLRMVFPSLSRLLGDITSSVMWEKTEWEEAKNVGIKVHIRLHLSIVLKTFSILWSILITA